MKLSDNMLLYHLNSSKELQKINLNGINDVIMFKNISNLLIPEHNPEIEGDTSSEFEDDFETWIQKIDSNPVIFEYMQYIELVYPVLEKILQKEELKKLCIGILDLNLKQVESIPCISTHLKLCKPGYEHICILNSLCHIITKYILPRG